MKLLRRLLLPLLSRDKNDDFLDFVDQLEDVFAKLLTLGMMGLILFMIVDLGIVLVSSILTPPGDGFTTIIFKILGLFLNVLIALEITQNITSYLGTHVIQIEMVLVTSLIAVARKIIILDLSKLAPMQLLALSLAVAALGTCYWLVRRTNHHYPFH
uniref:Phosphate-starvation-inducible E-like protein n=1 Tax=Cyanothece sp. (strain PCC 7425 / ATCC 29141) TaxID=395961 RepID=B8HXF3_CYAP4